MTRWLQAAKEAGWPLTKPTEPTEPPPALPVPEVLSVKSVLSGGVQSPLRALASRARPTGKHPDAAALADLLRVRGPMTYGAAASALGWGATRTWQAEARLRAAGLLRLDSLGRAELVEHEEWQRC